MKIEDIKQVCLELGRLVRRENWKTVPRIVFEFDTIEQFISGRLEMLQSRADKHVLGDPITLVESKLSESETEFNLYGVLVRFQCKQEYQTRAGVFGAVAATPFFAVRRDA